MPRWRALLFRCGLFVLAVCGLVSVFALVHTAGLDSDVQQGGDLVTWAHWTVAPALISLILCAFECRRKRAVTVALSLGLVCLCCYVVVYF